MQIIQHDAGCVRTDHGEHRLGQALQEPGAALAGGRAVRLEITGGEFWHEPGRLASPDRLERVRPQAPILERRAQRFRHRVERCGAGPLKTAQDQRRAVRAGKIQGQARFAHARFCLDQTQAVVQAFQPSPRRLASHQWRALEVGQAIGWGGFVRRGLG